jgi:recombination protein RecR
MSSTLPEALENLIASLSRLPGIGKKSATRLALHILRRPAAEAAALARDIASLHQRIHLCSNCFAFSEDDPCPICSDPRRDAALVCVVEGPDDMMAVEASGGFSGHYHVLHGALSPMDGIGPAELRLDALVQRLRRNRVREVIIATSSTVPGEATASLIVERLAPTGVRMSRLAHGIPMGMDVRYADAMTLARAIEGREDVRGRDHAPPPGSRTGK